MEYYTTMRMNELHLLLTTCTTFTNNTEQQKPEQNNTCSKTCYSCYMFNTCYTKFKNRPNQSFGLEVRMVVTFEGWVVTGGGYRGPLGNWKSSIFTPGFSFPRCVQLLKFTDLCLVCIKYIHQMFT